MRKLIFLILISFLYSCAEAVYIDKSPQNLTPNPDHKTVLILPFNSNFISKNPQLWNNINLLIFNQISEKFSVHNYYPIPYSDIKNYLIKNNFLGFNQNFSSSTSETLLYEYNNPDWSLEMKKEIYKLIAKKYPVSKIVYNINDKNIFDIAQNFNSDFIIRGEIYEFRIESENTLNPFKIGFINSPVKILSKALFGNSKSSGWGTAQEVFSGGLIGGIIGSTTVEPFEPPHHGTKVIGHPLYGIKKGEKYGGTQDYGWANAVFWGSIGAFTTYLASNGGYNPNVIIGIRVYLYNKKLKKMIWTNNIKVHVKPESLWCYKSLTELIEFGIETSINELFNSFWKNYNIADARSN